MPEFGCCDWPHHEPSKRLCIMIKVYITAWVMRTTVITTAKYTIQNVSDIIICIAVILSSRFYIRKYYTRTYKTVVFVDCRSGWYTWDLMEIGFVDTFITKRIDRTSCNDAQCGYTRGLLLELGLIVGTRLRSFCTLNDLCRISWSSSIPMLGFEFWT